MRRAGGVLVGLLILMALPLVAIALVIKALLSALYETYLDAVK